MDRTLTAINVGPVERWISVLAGGALVAYGLRQRSWSGWSLAATGAAMLHRGTTGHCMVYAALDVDRSGASGEPLRLVQSITVQATPQEAYSLWRDLAGAPRYMGHVERVEVLDERLSHWVARWGGRLGRTLQWDSEIVDDRPGERISWRSLPGADLAQEGEVEFRDQHGRGTAVTARVEYAPAGGAAHTLASWASSAIEGHVKQDLRRFKQLLETGEIATVEGQSSGRAGDRASYNRTRPIPRLAHET